MNVLHVGLLLLSVIQLVRAKPLSSTAAIEDQLKKYYHNELNILSREICPKLKYISDQVLQDETVHRSLTDGMQKFKWNMIDFQRVYRFYMRYNGTAMLVLKFTNMVSDYYYRPHKEDSDIVYIKQLMSRLGYDEVRAKYKTEFRKLVSEKFIPKYDELERQNSNMPLNNILIKWVNKLKNCQEYECYLISDEIFNPLLLNAIFENYFKNFIDFFAVQMPDVNIFAEEVLKDPQLSQLSSPIRQQFTENLHEIIRINDRVDNIEELYLFLSFLNELLYKFDNYPDISVQELRLIQKTLSDHGYTRHWLVLPNRHEATIEKANEAEDIFHIRSILLKGDAE